MKQTLTRIKTKDIPTLKEKLLKQQNGKCALCRLKISEPEDRCLDHCHVSGFIRAVLCRNCNAMEGKIFNCARRAKRDSTPYVWLSGLLEYWNTHSSPVHGLLHPSYKTPDEKRIKRNKKAAKKRKLKKEQLKRSEAARLLLSSSNLARIRKPNN